MSELTKQVRADQLRVRSRVQSSIVSYEMFDPNILALCDEHERLEGLLRAWDGSLTSPQFHAVYAESVRLVKEKP